MQSSPRSGLPIQYGDRGEAVLDIQSRLTELDLACGDPPGLYGDATRDALRDFQVQRGIVPDGVCNDRTWAALVNSGYDIGDRLLYRTDPVLRGDDVAEIQRRLSALGFDPGRIDGIYGDDTVRAVRDFQRNAALTQDGICGSKTLEDLLRLELREGATDLVSPLRERLQIARATSGLSGRSFAIAERGGFAVGVDATCRLLRGRGARCLPLHDPDPSRHAAQANTAQVDCVVSLLLAPERDSVTTAFYSGFRYESVTSRHLAEIVQDGLPGALGLRDGGSCGMAIPILRETRMAAIEVQVGSPEIVVQRTSELAEVVVRALEIWLTTTAA